MTTLKEMFKKLNQPIPEMPDFTSDDIAYMVMASLLPVGDPTAQLAAVTNLLLAFAFKIETLEEEVFALKFGGNE